MTARGRLGWSASGDKHASPATAVGDIAAVRDSDFRLLSEPVVEPWLKLTLARRDPAGQVRSSDRLNSLP
jgi:hypothetical protein